MITIHFDFSQYKDIKDLHQLNQMLQTLELTDLNLEDEKMYMAVTRNAKGLLLNRRCGFTSGTLECRLARHQPGHCYQISTLVADRDTDHEENLEKWRAQHPERTMRVSIAREYETANTYTIIHHEKVVDDCDV